jgi:hypothetical protein
MLVLLIVFLAIGGVLLFAGALSLYSAFLVAVAIGILFSLSAFVAAKREHRTGARDYAEPVD